MAGNIKELTDTQFNDAIARGVTLVDFWAPWCGPCRMQAPILEQVASEVGGHATIAKINVDENQSAARRYGVSSIPTLLIFKDGRMIGQFVGLQRRETLVSALRTATAQAA